jgi:hypothetical protein
MQYATFLHVNTREGSHESIHYTSTHTHTHTQYVHTQHKQTYTHSTHACTHRAEVMNSTEGLRDEGELRGGLRVVQMEGKGATVFAGWMHELAHVVCDHFQVCMRACERVTLSEAWIRELVYVFCISFCMHICTCVCALSRKYSSTFMHLSGRLLLEEQASTHIG